MRLLERLKLALSGRQGSDAIKQDIDALAAKAGAIGHECRTALNAAAALRVTTIETGHLPESSQAHLAALSEVLEAFESHETRIHQLVAEFHDAEHALVDRINALVGDDKTPASEKARFMEQIAAARQQAMDLHAQFLHEFMNLERLWQQWSPAASAGPQQDATARRKGA